MFWNKSKGVDLDSLSNKELEKKMEEFTEDGERASVILESRRKELLELYRVAYVQIEQKLYTQALNSLNSYLKLSEKYGEIVKEFVFELIILAATDSGEDSSGILSVYDSIVNYYRKKECAGLAEVFMKKREDYEIEVNRIKEMQERYSFSIDEEPVRLALERLESIKVNSYRNNANDVSFDAVWRSVLVQVDYYEQGEKGWNMLNKTTYKGAKNWLKSFAHLCKEDIPDEYKSKEE